MSLGQTSSIAPPQPLLRLRDVPPVELLEETADWLAVNKPAGLLAVPDRWDKTRANLVELLRQARPHYVANAHRLDKNTTGVFLLAKNKATLTALARQFEQGTVEKLYVALVHGCPLQPVVTVSLAIGAHPRRVGLSAIAQKTGRPATSIIRVRERYRRHALVEVQPLTGRQHQVRLHLHAAGCPVVADPDYGDGEPLWLSQIKPGFKGRPGEESPLLARPALHAERLQFTDPRTGQLVSIIAPWPKDLTLAVKYLRRYAA